MDFRVEPEQPSQVEEGDADQAHAHVRRGTRALLLPAEDAIVSHRLLRRDQPPMGQDHDAAFAPVTEGGGGASEGPERRCMGGWQEGGMIGTRL